MKIIANEFGQKKHIFLLGVLFMMNLLLLFLPNQSGSLSHIQDKSQDVQIPDMMVNYSLDEVYDFLEKIGSDGRESYQRFHLTTDLLFPIIYGLLLLSLTSYALNKMKINAYHLGFSGLLAAMFDLAENFTLLYIVDKFPESQPLLINCARFFTLSKFTFILLSMVILGYLLIKFLFTKLSEGNANKN